MSFLFFEQLYLANYSFAFPEHTPAGRRERWSRSRVGGREKLVGLEMFLWTAYKWVVEEGF